MNKRPHAIGMLILWTLLIAAVDQGIKGLVLATMQGKSHLIIPGIFSLSYRENTGAAFSMFNEMHIAVLLGLNLLVLVFFIYLIRPYLQARPGQFAAVLVLGGALGNLVDRVVRRHVIDYLDFHVWPVFNLADAFIVAGVALLVWLILRDERAKIDRSPDVPGGSTT